MTDAQKPAAAPLTALQERLGADETGEAKASVINALEAWITELNQVMRSGLTPTDYKRAEAILQGVVAAQKLIASPSQVSAE